MNKELLDAIESCLRLMEQGESLDSVLSRYPHLDKQLRPLLETAQRARSVRVASVPPAVLSRQRSIGLALAADLRKGENFPRIRRFSWRPVMTVLSVLVILVMSSNGLLIASAHSLPGDTLYPLKRSVESTQLHLVTNPAERETLEHEFEARRVDETRSLITDQRVEKVDFTGIVLAQSESEWLVSGIPVILDAQTQIDGTVLVGDNVLVHGSTNLAGAVVATRLTLVRYAEDDEDHPLVTPTQNPSLTPSGESGLQETPTGSSYVPDTSGEADEEASIENNPSPGESPSDSSSEDSDHSSSSEPEGEEE